LAGQVSPQQRCTKLAARLERLAQQVSRPPVPLEYRSWQRALSWRQLTRQQAMPLVWPAQLVSELPELGVVA
jgi:hypothetical protein